MRFKSNIFLKVFYFIFVLCFFTCSFFISTSLVSAQEELKPVILFEPEVVRLERDGEISVNLKVFNVTNLSSAELILVFTDNIEIVSFSEASEDTLVVNKMVENSLITMDLAKTENSFVEGEVIANIRFKLKRAENGLIEVVEGTNFGSIPVNLTEGRLEILAVQNGQVVSEEVPEDVFAEITKNDEIYIENGEHNSLNSTSEHNTIFEELNISSLETNTIIFIAGIFFTSVVIIYIVFRLSRNRK